MSEDNQVQNQLSYHEGPKRKIVKKSSMDSESRSQATQKLGEDDFEPQAQVSSFQNSSETNKTELAPTQGINQSHLQIKLIQNETVEKKQPQRLQKPIQSSPKKRAIQILAVSDNHGDYKMMNKVLQMKGDIFIHAGDFTYQGKDEDFHKLFDFLDKLHFKHKLVISGNHENVLSPFKLKSNTKERIISELKKRCTYLQHQFIEIEGVKIFASPYSPQYCEKPTSRAFQYKPSQDKLIWSTIPDNIDLLVTHGPPFSILDAGKNGKRAGSPALKEAVERIKPKYHIFGHIHESKGGMNIINGTTFMNLCNSPTRFVIQSE